MSSSAVSKVKDWDKRNLDIVGKTSSLVEKASKKAVEVDEQYKISQTVTDTTKAAVEKVKVCPFSFAFLNVQ